MPKYNFLVSTCLSLNVAILREVTSDLQQNMPVKRLFVSQKERQQHTSAFLSWLQVHFHPFSRNDGNKHLVSSAEGEQNRAVAVSCGSLERRPKRTFGQVLGGSTTGFQQGLWKGEMSWFF